MRLALIVCLLLLGIAITTILTITFYCSTDTLQLELPNNTFILLICAGYTTTSAPRSSSSTTEPTLWNRLDNLIKNKCLKNANKQQYKEVMHELNTISTTHWHSLLAEEHKNNLHISLHCLIQKPLILNYVERAISKLEKCLHPDELFLREFIMQGYKTYSQHFCSQIADLVSELPGSSLDCIRSYVGNPHNSPQVHCFKRSRVFSNQSVNHLITKQRLCEDLMDIKHCYERTLTHQCPHATLLKQFQLGILDEGLSHCHDIWFNTLKGYLKLGI